MTTSKAKKPEEEELERVDRLAHDQLSKIREFAEQKSRNDGAASGN
jgi:hypothetical protein